MPKRTQLNKSQRLPTKFQTEPLPFFELGETRFEDCCVQLCKVRYPNYARYELKRLKGNEQYGVDVECFTNDGFPETVLSAKCYEKTPVTAQKIETWVADFLGHIDGHWKGKEVRRFILAITKDGNNDSVNDEIRKQHARLKTFGIEFIAWFNKQLHDIAKENKGIVAEFFDRAWSAKIFPEISVNYSDASLNRNTQFGQDSNTVSDQQIEILRKKSDNSVSELLEMHIQSRRHGNSEPLRRYIEKTLQQETDWEELSSEIKGKIWRLRASLALDDELLENVEKYFEKSKDYASPPDKVLSALIAYRKDGIEEALRKFGDAPVPAELEMKAALLLEKGDVELAEEELKKCPESAEVYRLRALIAMQRSDLETAVTCASEALKLSPHSYAASVAFLAARLRSALIPGAEVSGLIPNPFNPALVRQDKRSQQHISDALRIADVLLSQCTGQQKIDCETWKLALLIAKTGEKTAAYRLVEELAHRSEPDPLHIAWALLIDAEIPTGRLRKYFEDEIRLGRGNSAQLVVRALLNDNEKSSPTSSAEIIEKHLEKFPRERKFLETWIEEFRCEERTLRWKIINGEAAVVPDYAKSFQPDTDDPEAWLNYVEVLAIGEAWQQINEIRDRLIKLPVTRARYIAAQAAFECYDYDGCSEIIDASATLQPDGSLPVHMSFLKARALNHSGHEGRSLNELVRLNQLAPRAELQRNIIQNFLSLGRPQDAVMYARQLIEGDDASETDLLIAAKISASSDPALAKIATEKLLEQGDVDPLAVPHLMEIQNRVGAFRSDLRQKFDDAAQTFFASEHVLHFETIEQALAHIENVNQYDKDRRQKWECGGLPAHAAFARTPALFAELMNGGPGWIETELGDKFPPILFTAGLPRGPVNLDPGKKALLTLDISALLLAQRFELFSALEQVFEIQVPRNTPVFLNALLERYRPDISAEDRHSFQKFERTALTSVDLASVGTDVTSRFYARGELPQSIANLLGKLKSTKIISHEKLNTLLLDLRIEEPIAEYKGELDPVCVSGPLLLSFIRCDVLRAVQQLTKVMTTASELWDLRAKIDQSEQTDLNIERAKKVQSTLSDRLYSNKWRSVPWPPNDQLAEKDQWPQEDNPLMASLSECLLYAARSEQPLVWIEDRNIGRLNARNILSLTEVVKQLADLNALSKENAENVRGEIAASGLGFLTIDPDVVIAKLADAGVSEGSLFETEALRDLRRAFGRQIAMLPFVDWSQRLIDEEGRPAGEARLARDVGFILPNLLKKLWFKTTLSIEHCIAASNWLWEHFRLEVIHRNEHSPDPEYIYGMASILLTDCALQPLFDAWVRERKGENRYSDYLRWLFSYHLNSRFDCDQRLEDAFVCHVVELLTVHLDKNRGDNDDINMKVIRRFAIETNNFLDLLPEYLKDEIYSFDEFAEKVYVKRDYFTHTNVGSFASSDVCDAIERAAKAKSKKTSVKISDSKKKATLKIRSKDEKVLGIEISLGERLCRLHPNTISLLAPDPQMRLQSLEESGAPVFADPELFNQVKEVIGREDTIRERIRNWNDLRASSFPEQLREISEKLEDGKDLSLRLFELPSSGVLLHYLRMDDDMSDPTVAIHTSFEQLEAIYGTSEAHKRLSVLEVLVSRPTVDTLDKWEAGENRSLFEDALLSVKNGAPGALPPWLSDGEPSFDQYIEFFVSLVRLGAQKAFSREDYQSKADWQVILLLWVWAAQITAVLSRTGINLPEAIKILKNHERSRIDQVLYYDGISSTLRYGGLEFSVEWCRQQFFNLITAQRTEGLDMEKDVELLNLIGEYREGGWAPDATLIFPRAIDGDLLLEVGDTYQDWISRGLINPSGDFRLMGTPDVSVKLIADFDHSPQSVELISMFSLSQAGELDQVTLEKLAERASHLLRVSKDSELTDTEKVLLRFYGRITGELNQTDRLKNLFSDLVARRIGIYSQAPLPSDWQQLGENELFILIVDAAVTHVRNLPVTIAVKIDQLCELFRQIHKIWPTSELLLRYLLIKLTDLSPVPLSTAFWQLVGEFNISVSKG